MKRAILISVLFCLVVAAPRPGVTAPDAPTLVSVDPPNWWVGHPMSTIQLLVRGSQFAGATLVSSTPGVQVQSQKVSGSGTTLIASVHIDASAVAGPVSLEVQNASGSVDVPFSLLQPLAPEGRFAGFTPDDVIYLLMPDRFADGDPSNDDPPQSAGHYDRSDPFAYHGGDLKGVKDHLAYLKDLGVTVIWVNPVYDNNDRGSDYHGYGATNFYAVDEHLGTVEDFRDLVDAAHTMGLKVIQDQVANHTGQAHPWRDDYPTPTWYNGTPDHHLDNVFDIASIVYPDSDPARRRATLEGWFGGFLPDLNQEDPDAAQYLIQNSIWWVDQAGLDGIRQDTLPYVPRDYWAQWETALHADHANVNVVGEVFNTDPAITSFFQGGAMRYDGIDSKVDTVFDFPIAFQIIRYFTTDQDIQFLPVILDRDSEYPNAQVLVPFIGNHDTARFFTGGKDVKRLMMAQTVLLTMRGTPQLYYGDEIAMKGGNDPDNRRDFPGGFPGDRKNAFTAEGRSKKQNTVFNHLRELLALRRAHASLRGATTTFLVAAGGALAYVRASDGDRALVVVNNSDNALTTTLNLGGAFPDGATLADGLGAAASAKVKNGKVKVKLGARSSAVFLSNS